MATTVLQQEILNILRGTMPETDKQDDEQLGGQKRPISPVDEIRLNSPALKKLKSSSINNTRNCVTKEMNIKELIKNDGDDEESTDSDDISDDDDIEIVEDIPPVSISSALLSIVDSVSKEVLLQNLDSSDDRLNQSGDTGFCSDDNSNLKISKSNSDNKEIKDDLNSNDEEVDVDSLLLSSPIKSQPELLRNPLYTSSESEDSRDSRNTESEEGSNSNSTAEKIHEISNKTNEFTNVSAESISSGDSSLGTDKDDSERLKGINSKTVIEASGSSESSFEESDDDDDITVLEITSLGTGDGPPPNINLSCKKESDQADIHEEVNDLKTSCNDGQKPEDIFENEKKCKMNDGNIAIENSKKESVTDSGKNNSIILVDLENDDEVGDIKKDEDPSKLEEKIGVLQDEEFPYCNSPLIKTTKFEEKVEAAKEEVKLDTKSAPVQASKLEKEVGIAKGEKGKPDIKDGLDHAKIKKCYVHCERAKIPAGLPIPKCDDCVPTAAEDPDEEIELLDPYPGHEVVAPPCSVCHLPPDRVSFFSPGSGVDEATAVRDEKISVIPWDESLKSDWPPCFKASNLSVYDSMGHLVPYDEGLIEAGQQLYFSGVLVNILDDCETLAVDRIGPLTGWRRPEDGEHRSTSLVLSTCLEGTDIEYHVDCNEFSQVYKDALKKEQLYRNFAKVLNSVSANLKSPKPKSIMTELKESKVQRKSEKVRSRTPVEITPSVKPHTRSLKRKSSESEPSDDDWNPDTSRSGRKTARKEVSPESTDGEVKSGSTSHFTQIKKKVPTILKSLDSKAGAGKGLAKLLPGHVDSCDAVAAFLMFIYERQCIWINKSQGVVPMTKNKVMSTKWFTNMYRELDRGTIYFRKCIIDTVLKGVVIDPTVIEQKIVEKVLFRSIVYRLINKVETFTDFGGLPDLEEYPKFQKFLAKKKDKGVVIFTAAHQNMGYDRLMKTFEFVRKNVKNMASEIVTASKKRTIKTCQDILLKIPNVGAFFAWQILCDLLECRIIGTCTDNQWACLGPGAKNGLRRIFPLSTTKGELKYTRLLRDLCSPTGDRSGFLALGLQFPAFLNKPLSLKNVEHALCEYDKYFRSALGVQIKEREYSEQKSRSGLDEKTKCGDCDKACTSSSRVMCALCSTPYHKKCRKDWEELYHPDGTWLCQECHKSERAWAKEDFIYEEVDKNDEIEKAFFSGAAKKEARLKRKEKKEKKAKQIECIDLSSDEEEDDDGDEDDEASDNEVEYLESVKGHFFGVNFDETLNEKENTTDAEDEEDPFADVGVWGTQDDGDVNDLDEDILILS